MDLTIVLIHTYIRISLLKREQPFYSGQNGWSKCVPYKKGFTVLQYPNEGTNNIKQYSIHTYSVLIAIQYHNMY